MKYTLKAKVLCETYFYPPPQAADVMVTGSGGSQWGERFRNLKLWRFDETQIKTRDIYPLTPLPESPGHELERPLNLAGVLPKEAPRLLLLMQLLLLLLLDDVKR